MTTSVKLRSEHLDKAVELLGELNSIWGTSSAETRRLAAHRTRCEAEAKALEELASALSLSNKSAEDVAKSITFIRSTAPSLSIDQLDKKLSESIKQYEEDLYQALLDDDVQKALAASIGLEKCDKGTVAEEIYGEVRMWEVSSFAEWIAEARQERAFAARVMPNAARAAAAFEKAALASLNDIATILNVEELPKNRAAKIKALSDALGDLKECCGNSPTLKSGWDSILAVLRSHLKGDLEAMIRNHLPAKWSQDDHGVEQACLEVFGILSRAGTVFEPPASVVSLLLDRVQEAQKGNEGDIYTLLGSCNTLDYILSYLDDYTPQRTRAAGMLRQAKEALIRKACSELELHGSTFVRERGRYFQVQNPVLRTELRLEVAKAWKIQLAAKHRAAASTSAAIHLKNPGGTDIGDVNEAVGLFFEGARKS